MAQFRIVAIPTETAEYVRSTHKSPRYGFPAHEEPAKPGSPCRHCLQNIKTGEQHSILFTYDRFEGLHEHPQPGPIYIHATDCPRYPEAAGFPEEMRPSPRTVEAYAAGRKLVAHQHVSDGGYESVFTDFFTNPEVSYLLVNSTTAGCFTFRVERL